MVLYSFGLRACLLEIYTLDGLFVTIISLHVQLNHWTTTMNIHFTDDMIVMSGPDTLTMRYNDHNFKQNSSLI